METKIPQRSAWLCAGSEEGRTVHEGPGIYPGMVHTEEGVRSTVTHGYGH